MAGVQSLWRCGDEHPVGRLPQPPRRVGSGRHLPGEARLAGIDPLRIFQPFTLQVGRRDRGRCPFPINWGRAGRDHRARRSINHNASRRRHLRPHAAVGLPLMPHLNRAAHGRIAPLHPCQAAKPRGHPCPGKPRLKRLNPEQMPAHPRGRSAGPTMAKAVAESLVAIGAKVTMQVFLAGRNQLVDPAGIRRPVEIEILPEGRCPHVEHPAPVGADQIERRIDVATLGQSLEHVESVERGNALCAIRQKNLIGCFAGVAHTRQREERRPRFGGICIGHHQPAAVSRLPTQARHAGIAQCIHESRTAVECHHQKPLQAGRHSLLIRRAGPVEKPHAVDLFFSIGAHKRRQPLKKRREIGLLSLQIGTIARVLPEFLMNQHPPHRVAGDAVHPLRHRRHIARQIERFLHHVVIAKHRRNRAHFGVHVANPHQTIAFDAIPEVVLHAQMHGIGPGLPDAIEPLVAAAKRPDPRYIAHSQHRPHPREQRRPAGIDSINAHKAKAAGPDRDRSQPGERDDLIADRMVVLSVLFPAKFGHRLAGRFPQTHPHPHRVLAGCQRSEQFHMPLEFAPEIEEHARCRPRACRERAGRQRFAENCLPGMGPQQAIGMLDSRLALPEQPRGSDMKMADGRPDLGFCGARVPPRSTHRPNPNQNHDQNHRHTTDGRGRPPSRHSPANRTHRKPPKLFHFHPKRCRYKPHN